MNKLILKNKRAERRQARTRSKISGTPQNPRLSVSRSLNSISVQIIDDTSSKTLVSANDKGMKGTKTQKAIEVGKLIAKKATDSKIEQVVFDRGSFQYMGRVKALAEAAREAGLKF